MDCNRCDGICGLRGESKKTGDIDEVPTGTKQRTPSSRVLEQVVFAREQEARPGAGATRSCTRLSGLEAERKRTLRRIYSCVGSKSLKLSIR
jgi:hypothetical protein